ncbi:hypothetical protein B296_00033827 [Ensete ventricosum]|uniref:MORF/ORRM1/DAG-like MORF domain-containing protein n=1 Tax=Ensete ventricosum TaxID=4639 RepID=A0A427A9Z0_ENSVE|nr:hypothetical protein B296_00033827 [Ensete ventricosum]
MSRSIISSPVTVAAIARYPIASFRSNRCLHLSSSCDPASVVAASRPLVGSRLLRPSPALLGLAAASRIGAFRSMARRTGDSGYSPLSSGSRGGSGFSDRPPTEMAPLFPGCDYEHWLIVMDKPGGEGATKQQMIDCYVQTLAKVLGR